MNRTIRAGVALAGFCVLVGVGLVGGGTSCTVVTSRTDGQCFDDSECAARGASFANTRCSAAGTCELITLPEAGPDSGGACASNLDCNLRLNQKSRCNAGQCVLISNASCSIVDGDPTADDAIFVGVMTPRTGVNLSFGQNQYDVLHTAAAEWTSAVSGQSGAHAFVTIGCDELIDPAGTATFLANTVGVSAVFGPVYDADYEQALPIVTANAKFILSPRADDPKLAMITGTGKTGWSFSPSRSVEVQYFNNLLAALTPSVKASQGVSGDIKVAFAVATDPSSTNFVEALEPVLMFNGKSVAANAANYVRQSFPFSFSAANDYTAIVSSLAAAAPDLVVVPQEYDLLSFVRAVNTGWGRATFPRFLFLTEDGSVESELHLPSEKFAGKVDFVTWRVTAAEQANASSFATDFRTAGFGDPSDHAANLYDAFYENAYVFQSILDGNGHLLAGVDPGAYVAAVTALNGPGAAVNVGASSIGSALSLLASGGKADLDGASGPLTFDTTKGSPVQDAVLECITSSGTVTASGVTLSGSTGAAAGTYSCL